MQVILTDEVSMAFDIQTATTDEINIELSKLSIERRLYFYRQAEEKILEIGQENWNGDKKHFEARLREVQFGIETCEKQLAIKKSRKKCPMRTCEVNYV